MKLTDIHYLVSFDADLKLGMPIMRRATPQEIERIALQRCDQQLETMLDGLGRLALQDLDSPNFIAARREAISLRDRQVEAWIDYYERYPAQSPQVFRTVVYHDPAGGETE